MSRFRLVLPLVAALFVPVAQADYADACNNFLAVQDYPRALDTSIALLKTKNLSSENEYYAYRCQGLAFYNMDQKTKAIEALQKAVNVSRRAGQFSSQASVQSKLGMIYVLMEEYVKAEEITYAYLNDAKKVGDREWEATAYSQLGLVYESQGNRAKARMNIEKAAKIYREIGNIKLAQSLEESLHTMTKLESSK